jgi:hypothetical protein
MAYTTDWQFTDPQIGLQPITEISTTKNHPLGTIRRAVDKGTNANGEGEFVYALGVADTVAGSWVTFLEDNWGTALLVANAIGRVGIAMAANVASSYGWYQISGKAVGKCLAAFADNGNVYGTATAGSVDDAIVAGDRVQRCKGASAIDGPVTGMAEFEMDHPEVNDALAD